MESIVCLILLETCHWKILMILMGFETAFCQDSERFLLHVNQDFIRIGLFLIENIPVTLLIFWLRIVALLSIEKKETHQAHMSTEKLSPPIDISLNPHVYIIIYDQTVNSSEKTRKNWFSRFVPGISILFHVPL